MPSWGWDEEEGLGDDAEVKVLTRAAGILGLVPVEEAVGPGTVA